MARNGQVEQKSDIRCNQCNGNGQNRARNGNCPGCRGKGFQNAADQAYALIFAAYISARSLVIYYKNMRRFEPTTYEAALKNDATLLDRLKAAEKLVKEYEAAHPRRFAATA